MHAVLITFQSAAGTDDLAGPFAEYARALTAVPGLVTTTWLQDGATLGGFHLFADRRAAERYLDSELAARLTANPAFSGFAIRHFGVLEELSRITGSAAPGAAPR